MQVTEVYLVQKHPILKGCIDFQNGELKRDGASLHLTADDSSVKMMMDLISSANDFCIVFGICDYRGKMKEIDFESRRSTASVVLTPSVSENVTQSRLYADDNLSSCAPIAEGNLLARASSFENTWHAGRGKTLAVTESTNKKRQLPNERTKNRRRTRRNPEDRRVQSHNACWIAQHTLRRS